MHEAGQRLVAANHLTLAGMKGAANQLSQLNKTFPFTRKIKKSPQLNNDAFQTNTKYNSTL